MKPIKYLLALTVFLSISRLANSQSWSLTGNSGITPSTDFIGTTDSKSLRFRTNNTERMILDSLGNVGIGTVSPTALLNVNGTVNITGATTIGGVYSNAPAQLVVNYNGNSTYNGKGIKLVDNYSGSIVRLHSFNNGLYLTTDNGAATGMILGSRFNPSDNSEFRAGFNRWEIRAGTFSVNQDWSGNGQFEMTIGAADRKGIILKSASSQTANLQEWQTSSGTAMAVINAAGRMGLGTTNISDTNYRLFVEKGVRTRKVKVDQTGWADYVFYPEYKLRPLGEVEMFIKENRHLPEVPSAAEVEKNGLDLGDNQATLLKKIEELTLYLIDQNKKIEQLQNELKELKKQK